MQSIHSFVQYLLAMLVSFYSLSTTKLASNDNIAFTNFSGKKVLLVNTAINTADTIQFAKLEQLYQIYKDSLEIVAFPSNSFGNNPMGDSATKTFIQSHYNTHFMLAKNTVVKGTGIGTVYSWLADITKNGMMNSVVQNDFTKYLIDKNGNLIGTFGKTEDPMGTNIRNAIEETY